MSKRNVHHLRTYRLENRRPEQPFILADHMGDSPAKTVINLDALHAEALQMDLNRTFEHECYDDDCDFDAWAYVDEERARLAWEREEEAEAAHQEAVDREMGYAVDHWITYAPDMETVRDIFGGSDFTIIHSFRG